MISWLFCDFSTKFGYTQAIYCEWSRNHWRRLRITL